MKKIRFFFLSFQKLYINLGKASFYFILFGYVVLFSEQVNAADVINHQSSLASQAQARVLRDPFTTSDRMYSEIAGQSGLRSGGGQGFVPGYGTQVAPKMRLKGFMNKGSKKMVALLEIEGAGVYLVTEGDEIGLQAIGQNTVVKVVKVDINGVRVQTGQVNQVILVQ